MARAWLVGGGRGEGWGLLNKWREEGGDRGAGLDAAGGHDGDDAGVVLVWAGEGGMVDLPWSVSRTARGRLLVRKRHLRCNMGRRGHRGDSERHITHSLEGRGSRCYRAEVDAT